MAKNINQKLQNRMLVSHVYVKPIEYNKTKAQHSHEIIFIYSVKVGI